MTTRTLGTREDRLPAMALSAGDWLGFAAGPTFATMALLTGVSGGGPQDMCAAAHGASALTGMAAMYALMAVFHARPWLRLLRPRPAGPSEIPPQL